MSLDVSIISRKDQSWLSKDRNLLCLRTDGGGEYQEDMEPYMQLQGIVHQGTTSYTPQLNCTAGTTNRKLEEMYSSMLITARMDHK